MFCAERVYKDITAKRNFQPEFKRKGDDGDLGKYSMLL